MGALRNTGGEFKKKQPKTKQKYTYTCEIQVQLSGGERKFGGCGMKRK